MSANIRILFPPIIEAKMDAFDKDISPRLYFSPSILNTREQFKHAQISIHRLNSNLNALSEDKYPLGFMFITNSEIVYDNQKDKYYINLPIDWVVDNTVDTFYKLQIRFAEQEIKADTAPNKEGMFLVKDSNGDWVSLTQSWLNNQTNYLKFSEWSTVCVIKPITPPSFGLQGFDENSPLPTEYGQPNTIPSNFHNFIGFYFPQDKGMQEVISNYRMVLSYTLDGKNYIEDTGVQTVDDYHRAVIQHSFKVELLEDVVYNISFEVISKDGYHGVMNYEGKVLYPAGSIGDYEIKLEDKNQANLRGSIKLMIKSTTEMPLVDNFVIKRTSHRTNFKVWEDVFIFAVNRGLIFDAKGRKMDYYTFYDNFVESGVMYMYGVQPAQGARRGRMKIATHMTPSYNVATKEFDGPLVEQPHPAVVDFNESWLIGEKERIFNISYGMSISTVSNIIKESVVETFGSQYPFVTRNGNVNYRQFAINGTITSHMDEKSQYGKSTKNSLIIDQDYVDESEVRESDIYTYKYYQDFLRRQGITNRDNNYIYEREFRDDMVEFLQDGKPKVLKTYAEGITLVVLTGVSLTPKNELGRTIYDFSCTANEIGDADLETLMFHGIKNEIPVLVEIPDTVLPYVNQIYAGQMAPAEIGGTNNGLQQN